METIIQGAIVCVHVSFLEAAYALDMEPTGYVFFYENFVIFCYMGGYFISFHVYCLAG